MAREDRKKWWFELKSHDGYDGYDEVFVHRESGPISHKGEELKDVLRISHSEKVNDKVKVYFRNKQQPVLLKLATFDFSANEYSNRFKNVLSNPSLFGKTFHGTADDVSTDSSRGEGDLNPSTAEQSPAASSVSTLRCVHSTPTNPGSLPPSFTISSLAEEGESVSSLHQQHDTLQVSPLVDVSSNQAGPSFCADLTKSRGEKRKRSSNPDVCVPQSSDKEFEMKVHEEMAIGDGITFKVLTSNLCAPREEYKLRNIDELFVQTLEREMLLRPLSFGRPLIAIVRGLKEKALFINDELDSYTLEVIGGNHRREALQNILQDPDSSNKEEFRNVDVQLFLEMPPEDALRLAHLHNEVDKLHHSLSFIDKLCLFRRLLKQQHNSKKTAAWKEACALLTGESVSQLDYVFGLNWIEDNAFGTLINVLKLYGSCRLKGQKARKKDLESGTFTKGKLIDCPTSKFKCLRGDLTQEEVLLLLMSVEAGKCTLVEMQNEACKIKELREVQKFILNETCMKTWEEAQKRFPEFASEGFLTAYRGHVTRGGKATEIMKDFVKRLLSMETETAIPEKIDDALIFTRDRRTIKAYVMNSDALKINEAVSSKNLRCFPGCGVVFLDLPKDWTSDDLQSFFRSLKCVNLRKNVSSCAAVVFTTDNQVSTHQITTVVATCKEMKCNYELSYYHDSSRRGKDGKLLTAVVTPMVICHLLNQRPVSYTNCFSFRNDEIVRDESGDLHQRSKPVSLYRQLLTLYGQPDLWVMDACSVRGSAAVASVSAGYNCVTLEKKASRVRWIKRRLLKSNDKEASSE